MNDVDSSPSSGVGGYVRWADLRDSEHRLRQDHRNDLAESVARRNEAIASVSRRLDAHVDAEMKRASDLAGRVDKLESWRDRSVGPAMLIVAILAIVSTLANLVVIVNG